MNISWLTLRDLEYVVVVARVNHFSKAAENCRVSQPTLSAQIKKIEEVLGVILFERSNKRVAITEAGARIVEQAKVVLEEAEKIPKLALKDQTPLSGDFRLGIIATLSPFFVPHFLKPLRRNYSSLRLLLREGLTDSLLRELKEGTLDAVVAARSFDESGFQVFPLFFEPFVLATPTTHPLTNKKTVSPSDLRIDEMILLEDGHCLRDQTINTCPVNRRGNVQQFHAASVETLRHLVASGLGYSLLPKLATQGKPLCDLVAYREFETKTVGRELALYCRKRYHATKDVEELARLLQKVGSTAI